MHCSPRSLYVPPALSPRVLSAESSRRLHQWNHRLFFRPLNQVTRSSAGDDTMHLICPLPFALVPTAAVTIAATGRSATQYLGVVLQVRIT